MINCLNINYVTICRAKCLIKVTLKVLRTTCLHYNSEEKSRNFLIFNCPSFIIDALEVIEKIKTFEHFYVYLSREVSTFISVLQNFVLSSNCLIVWLWLKMKDWLLPNVLNKRAEESGVFALISHIVLINEIF